MADPIIEYLPLNFGISSSNDIEKWSDTNLLSNSWVNLVSEAVPEKSSNLKNYSNSNFSRADYIKFSISDLEYGEHRGESICSLDRLYNNPNFSYNLKINNL